MRTERSQPEVPPGGEAIGDFRWEPWTPAEVAARLSKVNAPWAVASGWALDLFRGRQTRDHRDIDIAIPAAAFDEVREALVPFEFWAVGDGRKWPVTDGFAMSATRQTWLRDPATGSYKLDLFREPHEGDVWICRRDRSITMPFHELLRRDPHGIPFVAPEVVLLFKAKASREHDERDFEGALPMLGPAARGWLGDALERVHPGHPWISRLGEAPR